MFLVPIKLKTSKFSPYLISQFFLIPIEKFTYKEVFFNPYRKIYL